MSTSKQPTSPKRRGRRPAGQETKDALLAAAREVFAEAGYEGATVRAIAARADVDAAMVNHWYGSKEALFGQAVLKLPFNVSELADGLMEGDVDDLGERIVRTFISLWDSAGGGTFVALVRSIASHEQATYALRDFFMNQLFGKLSKVIRPDRAQLRATLCATQIIGMGMVRYVAEFEPLASADVETLVPAIAPNLQRYLTGDIN